MSNVNVIKLCVLVSIVILSSCFDEYAPRNKLSVEEQATMDSMLEQVINNLVFVEGGTYLMGDFGRTHTEAGLPFTMRYATPVHEVTLDSFYISKFKITNEEYQIYIKLNGFDINYGVKSHYLAEFSNANSIPVLPAHMYWEQANKYCAWLADKTGLAFALPTEAQWEYAARSRGKMTPYATDTGWVMPGINMPTEAEKSLYAFRYNTGLKYNQALPGDYYPPNPLGVYDMVNNGYEWVNDWFDPDYYATTPKYNPIGPSESIPWRDVDILENGDIFKGEYNPKVVRSSNTSSNLMTGTVFERAGANIEMSNVFVIDKTARCVVNQSDLGGK